MLIHRRFLFLSVLIPLICCAASLRAQGGPPFITDDPGTPGNGHWEINLGLIGSHNPAHGDYDLPNVDINYGLGKRLQLKYEVPLTASTDAARTTRAGLGDSLLGIKFRPYEHHKGGESDSDDTVDFSLGTYPQMVLSNPTRSVERGIVDRGPQYYLPLEATARIGWLSLNGEVGRWIGNASVPDRWGRGVIAGHAFSEGFELYTELYDLQDINRIGNDPKQRAFTLDVGGRRALDRSGHLRLLFMGGRSVQCVSRQNSQPDWIAYLGLQIELAPGSRE